MSDLPYPILPLHTPGVLKPQARDKGASRHPCRMNPFRPRRIYTREANMPDITTRDTVILGSGCAGLTAAIYTARANLKPLVLEGHEPGGQLSITTLVENFPGWPEGVQGPELIENMKQQATRFGAELRMAHLSSIDRSKHPFALNIGH